MRGARPDVALAAVFARAQPFGEDDSAILAVSGGSDSVALAGIAATAAGASRTTLRIVHVNHQLRVSAAQDEAVVMALAAHLHVPIDVVLIKPQGHDEAQLRELRYAALRDIAETRGASCVLTGHSAQDQTETVLLALFRGAGRDGLCGMATRRELTSGIDLVRPLLRADRRSLQGYCERAHLPYVVDPTNVDEKYTRNAVRRHLAELRPLFPGLDRAVARCASILREEREGDVLAVSRGTIRAALHAAGLADDLTFERIDAAARMLQLSNGRKVRIEREDDGIGS